jgi:flavodoxin
MAEKKALVVYYSRTGVTKEVAEAIVQALGCDTEEIQDVRSRKGLFGWLRSGFEAAQKKCPEIKPSTRNPSDYELVVIGTPVWANTMASPVRTWLTRHQRQFEKIALFCTMGGSDNGHTFPDIGGYCDADSLAQLVLRKAEVTSGQFAARVREFVARLQ